MRRAKPTTASRFWPAATSPISCAATPVPIRSTATTPNTTGDAAADTSYSIENLHGSSGFDDLRGDNGANTPDGGGGDDVLEGRGGADTLIGDIFSFDTASYASSASGVTADLGTAA